MTRSLTALALIATATTAVADTIPVPRANPLVVQAQNSEPVCVPRDQVTRYLADEYGETLRLFALTSDGAAMLEFFAHNDGSWTLMVTQPNGTTCMSAAGNAWGQVEQAPLGDPA